MSLYVDPLWVVTSYYNPAGYKNRLQNFKSFRKNLGPPLLVVELARAGQHHLDEADGDIVLRLTGEDRIWQKERLLNIGIAALPPHVEYVAWVDCDVVFADPDWPRKAVARLAAQGGLLQLFDTSVHLPRGIDVADLSPTTCATLAPIVTGVSVARSLKASAFDENEVKLSRARTHPDPETYSRAVDQHNCYGMAWAAPRATIAACGHYDRSIIGGGDAIHVFAALSKLDTYWSLRAHTEAQKVDVQAWADTARAAGLFVHVDSLDGKLFHMWHGDFSDRSYRRRYDVLARGGFDPARDIERADNGTWRWRDPDSVLAQEVGAYFFARHEDGPA